MKRSFTRRSWLLTAVVAIVLIAAAGGAYAGAQGSTTSTVASIEVVVNQALFPGQSVTIGTAGPLTITAVCNPGSPATAQYLLTTTEAHTSMDAGPQSNNFGPGDINFWGPISVYEANFEEGSATWHQFSVFNSNTTLAGGGNVQNSGRCQFGGVFNFVTSSDAPPHG